MADLEDAVAPAAERGHGDRALVQPPIVRVNGAETRWFEADLALVEELTPAAIVLPKATPEAAAALGEAGPPVIAIIETAAGVGKRLRGGVGAARCGAPAGRRRPRSGSRARAAARRARDPLCALEGRARLGRGGDQALAVRRRASRRRGRDDEGSRRSAGWRARSASGARRAFTRRKLPIVNRVFAPSEAEVEWAREGGRGLRQETDEGRGVFALNGAMVDLPVVERARRVPDGSREDLDGRRPRRRAWDGPAKRRNGP